MYKTARNPLSALALSALVVLSVAACAVPLPAQGGPSPTPSPAYTPPISAIPSQPEQEEAVSSPASAELAAGPADRLRFERLSVEQGLSHAIVYSILQDRQGYMWFGTWDGLNKYDGYNFTIYRHDPEDPGSLSNNVVWAVYEDPDGTIWVGTEGGLDRFDPGTGRFGHYRHDPNDPRSLSHDRVSAIYEDGSGALWVGTWGRGLNKLDRETGLFTRYEHDPTNPDTIADNTVTRIHEDPAGRLWVATSGGLDRFDRDSGRFVHYRHDPSDPASLSDAPIRALCYSPHTGALWVGTAGGGLDRFDSGTGRFVHYRNDPADSHSLSNDVVWEIYEDGAGRLWVGTDDGLNQYDPEKDQFIRYQHDPKEPTSLSGNSVSAIREDRSGVLWLATAGAGLNKLHSGTERFKLYRNDPEDPASLSTNEVRALLEDSSGNLWVGTPSGLDRYDRNTGRFTHYRHDPQDPGSISRGEVNAIYEDPAGTLWVGTRRGGLNKLLTPPAGGAVEDPARRGKGEEAPRFAHYRYDPKDFDTLSQDYVLSIRGDRQGALWVGTYAGGINRFDPRAEVFTRYLPVPDDSRDWGNIVQSIWEDREGVLWAGTGKGLFRFDRDADQFTRFGGDAEAAGSLAEAFVEALHEDRSGALWAGTTAGLYRLDPGRGEVTRYTTRDGLPSNSVCGILEDDQGVLWISTYQGISRLDPQAGEFRNYDFRDGVQGGNCIAGAYHRSREGEMFFGGTGGYNAFYPAAIRDNLHVPPVVLTSLTRSGEPLPLDRPVDRVDSVVLRWPGNFFEFEFAALSFAEPERNQYAYMLEGFDKDWNYAGTSRSGRYTNLPGGSYTLHLRGSNNDGVWNEVGTSLRIAVVPPFWQTRWFQAVLALALAGLVVGGYRLRMRSIEARSRELEQQVEERTYTLAQRTDALEQRGQELEALYRADEELYHHLRFDEVLQALVDIAVDILETDKSAFFCWDEGRERLVVRVARGFSAETMARLSFAPGEGIAGHVAVTGQPFVVEDTEADTRWAEERPETVQIVLAEGIRAFMHLPVKIEVEDPARRGKGEEVFGVFNVSHTHPYSFGDRDRRLFAALAQRAAVAIQNARHFSAEERRAEQFRVIAEVGRRITSIFDINELLEHVARLLQQAFGYYHVGMGLIEGDELVYRVGAGVLWDDPGFAFKPPRLKVGQEGIGGWVAATGKPLMVPDVSREPRYLWMRGCATRSELTLPILIKEQVVGVLDVQSNHLNAFDDTDLAVLQALANQVGAAIENAQLYGQAQQLAALQERARLARELHDAVTQTLFSASLIAEALPATWESDHEEGRQLLGELRQLSRGALAEMRTLLMELRPAALTEADLGDLLRQLGEAVTGRAGIPVTVTVEGRCQLPEEVHIALYRIAQEALNNVVKHARADQVNVTLHRVPLSRPAGSAQARSTPFPLRAGSSTKARPGAATGVRVELEVVDDGQGFDPLTAPPERLGLGILRERAASIGAELEIDSAPGKGTRVKVVWMEDK